MTANAAGLLASPRRQEIMRLIWSAERSAGDIHRAMPDVSFAAVSQHLRLLSEGGLVRTRRDGRLRCYVANRDAVGPLADFLTSLWADALWRLKLHAELEQHRRGPHPTRSRVRSTRRARRTRA
jgi:DNA-binding transcriptional ArsR family regulator